MLLIRVLALSAALLGAAWIVNHSRTQVATNAGLIAEAVSGNHVVEEGEALQRLFYGLLRTGIVKLHHQSGRLNLQDCDLIRRIEQGLVRAADLDLHEAEGERPLNLLKRLCQTKSGETVLDEIDHWNRGLSIMSIRDNHGIGHAHQWLAHLVRDRANWQPEQWLEELARGRDPSLHLQAETRREPLAQTFGFAVKVKTKPLGAWSSFDTTGLGRHAIALTRTIPADAPRELTLQVIGRIVGLSAGDQAYGLVYGHALTRSWAIRAAQVIKGPVARVDSVCLRPPHYICLSALAASLSGGAFDGAPRVDTVTLRLPPGVVQVTVGVRSSPFRNRALQRLQKPVIVPAKEEREHGYRNVFGPERILLRCLDRAEDEASTAARSDQCQFIWRLTRSRRQMAGSASPAPPEGAKLAAAPAVFTVSTAAPDPVVLAETASGAIANKAAEALSLTRLIGADDSDEQSLAQASSRSARSRGRIDVSVTIEQRLQRLAVAKLAEAMEGNHPVRRHLPRIDDDARHAALVLINAENDRAGEILAAAEWPPRTRQSGNAWDAKAHEWFDQTDNPLASRLWSQTGHMMAPGSSFKLVTALAILDRIATGGPGAVELERLMLGVPPEEARRLFNVTKDCEHPSPDRKGVKVDCLRQAGIMVRNNSGGDLASAVADLQCTDAGLSPGGPRIGLRQALAFSSNIWFAAMVDRIGDNQTSNTAAQLSKHPFAITIDRAYNDFGAGFELVRDKALGRVGRATAQRILADFRRGGPDAHKRLLLAAYGATVQATPIAMASIAAAIANGWPVRPTLTPGASGRFASPDGRLPELIGGSPLQRERLLAELRCGMRHVVKSGTARGRVIDHRIASDMWAKTGSARIDAKHVSAWFVGWLNGSAATERRRIAFACMVTHAARSGSGSGVCAPLISELLVAMRGLDARGARGGAAPGGSLLRGLPRAKGGRR